ncbi:MAG: D-alanyl-D-alanine carboxypeptidase/D-alanyl-D-alanine-endopeptidase [Bacteroidales bacterium]|jgi:D-alanyl-D-alanine carboxypeptidase/D-alanyl-D-alanine-endopeptidase (penicillin-binding protein 4)|nr:D-alanyl-D-alanine carboxypeptidase/D-alanyl-D-alanine-endopeptidase [Bacteroidales bacterium]
MRHIVTICFLLCSFTLAAQDALQTYLAHDAFKHATVGFELRELSTGKTISAHNPQLSCTPASVTKLITTATAIEVLGADYSFKTQLAIDGSIDSSGVLQGNLYIIGGGDPTLGSRFFPQSSNFIPAWIEAVRKAGITKIQGNILAKTSLYDLNPVPVLWLHEDIGNYYGAGVFALSWSDNTIAVTIENGDVTKEEPEVINYVFSNNLQAGIKDSIYFSGQPFIMQRTIYGTFRPNTTRVEKVDMSNPPSILQMYVAEQFQEKGLPVQRSYFVESNEKTIIHTHHSPPLKEIIKQTSFTSNNNYAEHILKHLALQTDSVATFNGALQVQRNFWTKKGIDMSGVWLYDGSGLSPKNAITPAFVCDVLLHMKSNTNFRNSLPVAGESGTVSKFLISTPLKGKVRVKSGSFRGVQSYAGYISHNEKEYAFCIMVNNFTGARAHVVKLIEQLLNSVVNG